MDVQEKPKTNFNIHSVIRDKSLNLTKSINEAVAGHCRQGWMELLQGFLMKDLKMVQVGDPFPGNSWCLSYFRLTQWNSSPPFLWGLLCSTGIRPDRTGGTGVYSHLSRSTVSGGTSQNSVPKRFLTTAAHVNPFECSLTFTY